MLKIANFQQKILEAKKLAESKLAQGENADEFLELAEADGFKIYLAAGKTVKDPESEGFHENPRDVFMLILEGEIEFTFENGEKIAAKTGEYFVLPKHTKHRCTFRKMTVAVEMVNERGL